MRSRLPLLSVVVLTQPCFSRQVFYGSRRLAGGSVTSYCQGSGAFQTMQPTWEPQSGSGARIGWYGQTIKHSQASSPRTSHTRLLKAWAKRQALRIGLSNVARREWRTAGVKSEPNPSCDKRGTWKSRFEFNPALAVPRQAHRKAGPGETALRGSNKLKPLCNRADTPTSIWSLIVRKSMEPNLLGNANDDRRLSISASQSWRKDRHALRLPISMAKVAPLGVGRDMPDRICPLKGLSRMKGNFHVRF